MPRTSRDASSSPILAVRGSVVASSISTGATVWIAIEISGYSEIASVNCVRGSASLAATTNA